MGFLRRIFGEVRWTPPNWLTEIGVGKFLVGFALTTAFILTAAVIIRYVENRPQPPKVVASVVSPGITPYTEGELSPLPLKINFKVEADPSSPIDTVSSVARIDLVNTSLTNGISIEPSISGVWRWDDENRLEFKPSIDWPAGQKYVVRFETSLFAPNLILASTDVEFVTPSFSATIDEAAFYQDPVDSSLRKVVTTLSFSHPVDVDSLRQKLSYTMRATDDSGKDASNPVAIETTFDKHRRKAYVHSAPIDIPREESYVKVLLSGQLSPADGPSRFAAALNQDVLIPNQTSYFRVTNAQTLLTRNSDDEPLQTLTIEFTDRVKTSAVQDKLNAYILPNKVMKNGKIEAAYYRSAREITPAILQKAEKVDLKLNPTEGDSGRFHSATFDLPERRAIYLRIDEGLTSDGEYVLDVPSETLHYVPAYPQEVSIAQSGAVLPLTSSQKLTFVSRGLATLKVEVARLIESEVKHLASQTRGDIKSPLFSNYSFSQDNITQRSERFITLNSAHPQKATYSSLDLSEYVPDGGYYFVSVQGWNTNRDYAVGHSDKRFILITDLGLMIKTNSDHSQDIFVHSIQSGEPIAGASVELLGKNGLPVATSTTSADGHALMNSTYGFRREKEPTVFLVSSGTDSVFMPYARAERQLQYSRFDIGGEYVQPHSKNTRLKALLFSDRKLYRPGDTATIAAVVKRDDWQSLSNAPLKLKIVDPRGKTVMDKRLTLPDDGFFDITFSTDETFSTGNYNATLYLLTDKNRRRSIGNTNLKIEEFLPDRLRIHSTIKGEKTVGWVKPGELVTQVTLSNLFGTVAQDRRVTGQLELRPSSIRLSQHPGYLFDDPLRERRSSVEQVSLPLAPTKTNEEGIALLPLDLRQYDKGIYRLSVFTEGFEDGGGRSVKAETSVTMSPLDYLIGYKTDGDLSFVDKNSSRTVAFLAVDSNTNVLNLTDLTLSIFQEDYVSTLIKRKNGTFAYQSIPKEKQLLSQDYALPEAGSRFDLPTDKPGTFVVKIADSKGLIYSKVRYTVAGARNLAGNLERDAELSLNLKGKSFEAGEEIEMEITAPYAGTGLITIERDRVYAYKWFNSDSNTSVQRIKVPSELEGSAYVNVAFIRDIDSEEIFVSPLSYAVKPFAIGKTKRTVDIDLHAPELVRPGDKLDIAYSSSKPARVAIYAVSEGILQVAKYEMPDPLNFFLPKQALQVNSFQMADLILPDFETYVRSAAPGGGDAAKRAGKNLNPFSRKTEAPVAFWSGIVDSSANPQTVSFDVPDYFSGELRIMAVAVSDGAVGRSQTKAIARGPFVISPSLLTAASPGDEFEIVVGLSNNLEGSGPNTLIDLVVTPSEHLEIIGEPKVQMSIDEGREDRTILKARALNKLGSANITVEATSGAASISRQATLSVRPATAYVSTLVAGISNEDPLTLGFDRTLYDQLATNSAAASVSPLILTDGIFDYLKAFPHLCSEQIVSKVFPQIGFLGKQDSAVDESEIRQQFDWAIQKLRGRQNSQGGFLFWTTSFEAADFPSAYVMHFLTDATELGLPVPKDMLASGLDYLRRIAAKPVKSLTEARLRAYAIYVITRNGRITTNYLTNLHEHLDSQHTGVWRRDLTASYMAASYALLKKSAQGSDLISEYQVGTGDEMTSDFDTRLGRDSQYVYLLARHFPQHLDDLKSSTIQQIAQTIMKNRFNTLSSAYAVLALGEYTEAVFDSTGKAALELLDATEGSNRALMSAAVFARASTDNNVSKIKIGGSNGADIYYLLSQTGFDTAPPAEAKREGLEISREYLNEQGEPVNEAQIGQELSVRLRVRSTGRIRSNVAVVDLLPGGFEVLTESVRDQYGRWSPDYKDVREDRVIIYGSFTDRITEINYRVKLTSAGDFVVPAAYAGSMYDRSIESNTKPTRFVVQSLQSDSQAIVQSKAAQ